MGPGAGFGYVSGSGSGSLVLSVLGVRVNDNSKVLSCLLANPKFPDPQTIHIHMSCFEIIFRLEICCFASGFCACAAEILCLLADGGWNCIVLGLIALWNVSL